ncbi:MULTISPECIES: cell division protein PerM [Nocardia]|uniref:cell division protein PerM n=1 Tax=Nocardia TaxID=1817 RepID=UPI000BF13724|nr:MULTISPECIES: DUF6350 family protein [Nocardia]MBF6189076.1 hypothetical protein [Nocardia farcinica]MBF6314866.1 hypothetical protein [Nocardia farcinica]MBF6410107.1 hypothetical protein [Nocardia farcinica]PEH77762.1 hypothetical protein CRM89_18770 [Nocardia sp. FDAARGOS_372]UEX22328.1 DUF6350 family protein [Nocardia farcinica]
MSSPRNSLVRWTGESPAEPEPAVRSGPATEEPGFLSLTPERARVLLFVAARPAALALLVVTVLVVSTLLTSGGAMTGTSAAIAASWLGMHQVPLEVGKTTLGLLPLLPTAVLLWAAARECARAAVPNGTRTDLAWLLGAALGGPLLVTAVCLAVVTDASGVLPVRPPNTLAAFAWVLGLHLLAAGAGIASRELPRVVDTLRLPPWAVSGIRGAGRSLVRLLACAAAVTVISLFAHYSTIGDIYSGAGDGWGVLGLTVLSVLYLPNVVIGALGVLLGATAEFGTASVGLFSVVGGPVPAVPVLAAMPMGPAAGWWALLLVVPAAVGVLGGLDLARLTRDEIRAPWATLTSAAVTTVLLLVAAVLAGGELGGFGHVGLDLPILAAAGFGWLAVTGWIGLTAARLFPGRTATAGGDHHGHADEHDDYYDDEHDYYGDDRYEDDRYEDDRYEDEHYEDEHYDDHDDGEYYADDDQYDDDARAADDDSGEDGHHDDRDRRDRFAADDSETLEGELVDEPAALAGPRRDHDADIVDAEVVESETDR